MQCASAQRAEACASVVAECGAESLRQVAAINEQLAQVREILNEAIGRLIASFTSMNRLIAEQKQLALDKQFGKDAQPAGAVKENEIAAAVERDVNSMVTSLQFQDMVTQLISHTSARVDALGSIVRSMEACARTDASSETADALREARRVLSNARLLGQKKPVLQTGIDSGEIELF